MSNGSIITNNGKRVMLYRAYTENADLSSTEYLPPTRYKVGINNDTPSVFDNDLDLLIPVNVGTVCDDGSNQLTGSSGGTNTTDNTTTYKVGGGVGDDTAQNLLANDTNASKIWTISDLTTDGSNADSSKYIGLWFYIKDSTTLAKLKTSGTCLEVRLGADTTTNYYSKTYEAGDLSTGWNWLSDGELLSTWTENGTPGTLNDFQIIITTNNATDEFAAGDVVYDLLRQWEVSDTIRDLDPDYPSFDLTNLEVTNRATLTTVHANGFDLNGFGMFNEDSSALMTGEDTHPSDSKSDTDEFVYIVVDRVR